MPNAIKETRAQLITRLAYDILELLDVTKCPEGEKPLVLARAFSIWLVSSVKKMEYIEEAEELFRESVRKDCEFMVGVLERKGMLR